MMQYTPIIIYLSALPNEEPYVDKFRIIFRAREWTILSKTWTILFFVRKMLAYETFQRTQKERRLCRTAINRSAAKDPCRLLHQQLYDQMAIHH